MGAGALLGAAVVVGLLGAELLDDDLRGMVRGSIQKKMKLTNLAPSSIYQEGGSPQKKDTNS